MPPKGRRTKSFSEPRVVPPVTRQVAIRLAAAHLNSSGLEPKQWRSLSKWSLEKFKDHPVIVAVGAGASKTVFPDARQAVEDLLRNLNVDPTNRDFQAERQRLEEVFGADRDAFETSLQALTATWWGDRRVREVLASMYEKRHVPLLRYEILAHLFKHRFVNAIINFNFDEELDQSISDELNNDEYVKIVSDGDWRRARDIQGQRLYIKPHGTISAPSTLRFTREAYWRTPSAVMAPLTRLIKGQPIVVITVGFALTSFEFNALLNESASGSEIYSFDIKQSEPQLREELKPILIAVDKGDSNDLDNQLALLWHGVKAVLPNLPLRGIWRHELVATLFRDRAKKPEEPDQQEYFYERTLVEICLAFAKGKGLLNLSALVEDRTGIYFDKYRKLAGSHAKSLVALCQSLGMQGFGYGHEIMTHKNNPLQNPPRIIPAVSSSGATFSRVCDELLRDLRSKLSDAARRNLDSNFRGIEARLQRLYESAEVEITGERRLETSALFHEVKSHLDNATALFWRTRLLLQSQWSRLYVVAETGEWLLDKGLRDSLVKGDRRIVVIVADWSKEDDLIDAFGDQIVLKRLEWWNHNRHMTIVTGEEHDAKRAIYFDRRSRSSTVSPIEIDDADANLVFQIFVAYWRKASDLTKRQWIGTPGRADVNWFGKSIDYEFEEVKARRRVKLSQQQEPVEEGRPSRLME